jgi:hypothetical protein
MSITFNFTLSLSGSKNDFKKSIIKGLKEAKKINSDQYFKSLSGLNLISIFSSVKKYYVKATEDKIDSIAEMLRTKGVGPNSLSASIDITDYHLTNEDTPYSSRPLHSWDLT